MERFFAELFNHFFSSYNYRYANAHDSVVWHGSDGLFLIYPAIINELKKIAREGRNDWAYVDLSTMADDQVADLLVKHGIISAAPHPIKYIVVRDKLGDEYYTPALQFIWKEFRFNIRQLPIVESQNMVKAYKVK